MILMLFQHIHLRMLNFLSRGDLATSMALKAVRTVLKDDNGRREIDIKRYAKVEKVRI